ncbi:carbon storage regulator CsrA [Pseudomonas arsenicoxydans]|uniref:Translational regulator CsrA n=1 Tax=Pseudomonas arsenicoxydans TaxID=702115 RepID=A0A502HR33_9PSED|nr:carbon storage regulator CsrA [Pseudomonas arsenicoxydans]TPG76285.1 carbon storage regulator [Pseudomonas arsenicoxydans]
MLVLNRKNHKAIIINEEIIVRVISIRGDSVRIGLVAPKRIEIHREEIYRRIPKDKKPLLSSLPGDVGCTS